jgi:hypothetical protein
MFIPKTIVRIIRLSATIAEQLQFLVVFEADLRSMLHGIYPAEFWLNTHRTLTLTCPESNPSVLFS